MAMHILHNFISRLALPLPPHLISQKGSSTECECTTVECAPARYNLISVHMHVFACTIQCCVDTVKCNYLSQHTWYTWKGNTQCTLIIGRLPKYYWRKTLGYMPTPILCPGVTPNGVWMGGCLPCVLQYYLFILNTLHRAILHLH